MIEYSPQSKISLSLREKTLSKDYYKDYIQSFECYGNILQNPKLSVILVAHNEKKELIRNLEHWKEQVYQNFEIILVDNGLDSETIALTESYNLMHIKLHENYGCCAGRNIGAIYAQGEVLVFVDTDGYVTDDYLAQIQNLMLDELIVAVRGKVLEINMNKKKDFLPTHYNLGTKPFSALVDTEGNSAWRAKDYLRVGGFEDSLAGGEGVVLQYRMAEFYGYDNNAFKYNPNLILHHNFHTNEKKLRYKIRQNLIVRKQMKVRYPFMDQFFSYYSQIRKGRSSILQSERQSKLIKDIKKELEEEYKQVMKNGKDIVVGFIDTDLKPNFSVIIPCYNLGSLLTEAIDSVFAQTLDDIEVIVVDDASPDPETQKVLDEVEKNVHVIRLTENGGVSAARNAGIEVARSAYILCLDADDTIEPTYLEKAKNVFDADECVGLVSCWARFFGGSDGVWKPKDKANIKDALYASPVHTATCFRKDLHEQGGGYDENLRGYEDWDHWLRIITQDITVRVIPESLFNYYVRSDSKVKTSNKNSKELVAGIVNNHRELYEKHVDVVVAQKHYDWVNADARVKVLENELKKCQQMDRVSITKQCKRAAIRLKKRIIKKPILK